MRTSPSAQRYKAALEVARRNLKKLSDAGVPIAMGTDTGPTGRFQGYFELMEIEMMVKAGLTPRQALAAATRDAARCMKLDRELGTIEPGKWADFVVLDANPLADIANTKTIARCTSRATRCRDEDAGGQRYEATNSHLAGTRDGMLVVCGDYRDRRHQSFRPCPVGGHTNFLEGRRANPVREVRRLPSAWREGPMSLLTYESARPYARAISTKVADGTMPPWHADAPAGMFRNDPRLTSAEKATIVTWASSGAPQGNPSRPASRADLRRRLVYRPARPRALDAGSVWGAGIRHDQLPEF